MCACPINMRHGVRIRYAPSMCVYVCARFSQTDAEPTVWAAL